MRDVADRGELPCRKMDTQLMDEYLIDVKK
jgi:hypothetical protein